jgi:hypothetical protein
VVRADQKYPGELAVRARRRLQRDRIHAGDLDEAILQELHDAQRTLAERLRQIGMRIRNSLNRRDRLVHPRVVLHRAGAERIHAEVDRIVPCRQPREVANDLDLAHLRHHAKITAQAIAQQRRGIHRWHIQLRQPISLLPRRRLLEDQPFVLIDMCRRLLRRSYKLHLCHRIPVPI